MAAYLSKHGYLHDVFVSYSHGDVNQAGTSLLKDWSTQFVDLLNDNLKTVLGPQVSIFLDASKRHENAIDRLASLTNQLQEKIEKSALLHVLMSPHYLDSRWCRRELDLWVASQSGKPGNRERRVAVARVLETDHKHWPQALKDFAGEALPAWWFYPRDGSNFPHGWMLDWKRKAPDPDFSSAMNNLTGALQRRLIELDEELTRQEQQRRQIASLQTGQVSEIYLFGRMEHQTRWEETASHLDRAGIGVKPGEPEPATVEEDQGLREKLARIASRCDAMLLVGADGFALDDDIDLIGRDRRNFIRSRFQKFLPCAVVDCVGVRTPQRVRAAQIRGIDWLDVSNGRNGWVGSLRSWLQQASGRAADSYGVDPNATNPNNGG
jgi:hypothetical protein